MKNCEECFEELGEWTVRCRECGALCMENLAKFIGLGLLAVLVLGAGFWKWRHPADAHSAAATAIIAEAPRASDQPPVYAPGTTVIAGAGTPACRTEEALETYLAIQNKEGDASAQRVWECPSLTQERTLTVLSASSQGYLRVGNTSEAFIFWTAPPFLRSFVPPSHETAPP